MRRIVLWFMTTVTALVLLFGYSTSTSGPGAVGGSTVIASGDPVTGGTASASGTTVTGSVVQTRWGPVQVAVTVEGSVITDVSVLQYPTGNGKDQEINSYALPVLVSETLDAQNAGIDMVSGATVTSDGYVQSLQSALDQAGL
ncbi:MAG: hypothetical protein JWQ99_490 [Blastococcus sp.]|jgi:uncharacterized protein with FMN-binding domain|nr:hypothetical protein [Blastococcus sp.]